MSQSLATNWLHLSIAVLVGLLLCALLGVAEFATRYWAAVGVFSAEDWMTLAPVARGKMVDYILGLAVGIGFWGIFHAHNQRGFLVALVLGAISMLLVPQLNAVLYVYVWRFFGAVDWSIALDSLVRAARMIPAGALFLAMWRIAYQKKTIVEARS